MSHALEYDNPYDGAQQHHHHHHHHDHGDHNEPEGFECDIESIAVESQKNETATHHQLATRTSYRTAFEIVATNRVSLPHQSRAPPPRGPPSISL